MTALTFEAPFDTHRLVRLLLALLLACTVVAALLFGMHAAITPAEVVLGDKDDRRMLDFVRLKRAPQQPPKPEPLPQRQPEMPPPPPDVPPPSSLQPRLTPLAVHVAPVDLGIGKQLGGLSIPGLGEGDYLPMVKVAPQYPARARRRGIEGYCTVSYTVTTRGGTADIRVLDEQCSHDVFHNAVIRAAGGFRYKPRIVDGKTVAVADVKTRFNFRLDD